MMGLTPTQLLIVLLIILVLFGAKRLPEMGRGLGRSVREFRAGITDGEPVDEQDAETAAAVEGDRVS